MVFVEEGCVSAHGQLTVFADIPAVLRPENGNEYK